ncbi:hypothetical protein OF117_21555 [Geodermatophilus sp. YIM 151500]|uniref:hypothetical protein n=1 Tax=Geodermatophilus sp. YIM 151500 TaxID=2984531 RepID=UPI0021E389B7|nr:hypothetical protein [Geodermatophilus sp. YIM 151500]MCV2491939.1 hypothetical protein [Geodermatophilus sp. YIM 151500]
MSSRTCERSRLLELARREQGAVEVTLFWDRGTGSAVVVVWNWSSGGCLQVDVEGARAGYAYAHPYAYAAARGVPASDIARAA